MKAYLILEDGTVFEGTSIGSSREVISEIVFNTSMTGYLEVLTDPSYAGQAVVMTCLLYTSRADQSSKRTQLGRVEKGIIRKLEYRKSTPYGVSPRNVGQYFFQEALMQPADKAPLVIVKGMAGTVSYTHLTM